MSVSLALAKFVFALHLFMMVVLIFGWMMPPWFLKFHMILVPACIVQWWLNNDQCILTQIQYHFEGRKVEPGEQGQFIKGLFMKFGVNPSETFLLILVYGIMITSFSLSYYRYSNRVI